MFHWVQMQVLRVLCVHVLCVHMSQTTLHVPACACLCVPVHAYACLCMPVCASVFLCGACVCLCMPMHVSNIKVMCNLARRCEVYIECAKGQPK